MNTQAELEEMEYLLSQESFDKWLYQNYVITNGNALLGLYESGEVQLKYLREHGLPDDAEIEGI